MIGPPIHHLGARASALLDGRLAAGESERAWEHVHGCHACRDLVEREGWVKQRLAQLSSTGERIGAPEGLKGSLVGRARDLGGEDLELVGAAPAHHGVHTVVRRSPIAVVGSGAVGAAVLGVLALGAAPAQAPTGPSIERRAPVAQLGPTTPRGPTSASVFSPVGDRSRAPRP